MLDRFPAILQLLIIIAIGLLFGLIQFFLNRKSLNALFEEQAKQIELIEGRSNN